MIKMHFITGKLSAVAFKCKCVCYVSLNNSHNIMCFVFLNKMHAVNSPYA